MIRAIILAAGENPPTLDWKDVKIPKCLYLVKGKPILKYIVTNLKKIGIDNYVTVVGNKGRGWENPNIYDDVKTVSPITINPENTRTGIARSFQIGWKFLAPQQGDRTFILDGDLIFRFEILQYMLNSTYNSILVQKSDSLSSKDGIVEVNPKLNIILRCGRGVIPNTYPWYKYSGISLFDFSLCSNLNELASTKPKEDLLSLISLVSENKPITIIHATSFMDHSTKSRIDNDLIGGSLANLRMKRIVRKECHGRGAKKLKNEYEWLLRIIGNNSMHFPKVLDYGYKTNYAWYEMPYYDYPSLRKELLLGRIDSSEAIERLEIILEYLWSKIYSKKILVDNKQKFERMRKIYFVRIENRINDVWRNAEGFRKVIQADKIILNGEKYPNLPQSISSILKASITESRLFPITISHIHGDLHFQNILLNPSSKSDFILTDPRGDIQGNDFFYDLGKLWHSFHGKYDFIHTGLYNFDYSITEEGVEASFNLKNKEALENYKKLEVLVPKLLKSFEWISKVANWEERVLFAEASHFSSVMPFHLNKNDNNKKAILLYLIGVKLLAEFCNKYGIKLQKYSQYIVNINEPFIAYDELNFEELD